MAKRKRPESPQPAWHNSAPLFVWQKWIADPRTAKILSGIQFAKSGFKLTELPAGRWRRDNEGNRILRCDEAKGTYTFRADGTSTFAPSTGSPVPESSEEEAEVTPVKSVTPDEPAPKARKPPASKRTRSRRPSEPKEVIAETPSAPPAKRTQRQRTKPAVVVELGTPVSDEEDEEDEDTLSSDEEIVEDSDSSYSEGVTHKPKMKKITPKPTPKTTPKPTPKPTIRNEMLDPRFVMSDADWAQRNYEDQMEAEYPGTFEDEYAGLVNGDDDEGDEDETPEDRQERQQLAFEKQNLPELVSTNQWMMHDIMDDMFQEPVS